MVYDITNDREIIMNMKHRVKGLITWRQLVSKTPKNHLPGKNQVTLLEIGHFSKSV